MPPNTTYPVDDKKYILNKALLLTHNLQLRNFILKYISDVPTRDRLAREYGTDGRALLEHLQTLAATPLTIPQVNTILADIQALTQS